MRLVMPCVDLRQQAVNPTLSTFCSIWEPILTLNRPKGIVLSMLRLVMAGVTSCKSWSAPAPIFTLRMEMEELH